MAQCLCRRGFRSMTGACQEHHKRERGKSPAQFQSSSDRPIPATIGDCLAALPHTGSFYMAYGGRATAQVVGCRSHGNVSLIAVINIPRSSKDNWIGRKRWRETLMPFDSMPEPLGTPHWKRRSVSRHVRKALLGWTPIEACEHRYRYPWKPIAAARRLLGSLLGHPVFLTEVSHAPVRARLRRLLRVLDHLSPFPPKQAADRGD